PAREIRPHGDERAERDEHEREPRRKQRERSIAEEPDAENAQHERDRERGNRRIETRHTGPEHPLLARQMYPIARCGCRTHPLIPGRAPTYRLCPRVVFGSATHGEGAPEVLTVFSPGRGEESS